MTNLQSSTARPVITAEAVSQAIHEFDEAAFLAAQGDAEDQLDALVIALVNGNHGTAETWQVVIPALLASAPDYDLPRMIGAAIEAKELYPAG